MPVHRNKWSSIPILGAALVFAGLASGHLPGFALAGVGLLLLLLLPMVRGDGGLLFGAFANWELSRTARGKYLFITRCMLASTALFYLVFVFIFDSRGSPPDSSMVGNSRRLAQMSEAIVLFVGFSAAAFAWLFTLVYFSAILVEERETRRLEHLLTTQLSNQEILLGKTLGRFAVLLSYLLTLLPILAVMTVLGVDPNLILVGCVYLGFSLLGLTGICLASSARARSTSAALFQSIATVALLLASLYFAYFVHKIFYFAGWHDSWSDLVGDFLDDLSPLRMIQDYQMANVTRLQGAIVLNSLGHFAAMQWLLFVLGWSYASWSLRQPPRLTKKAISQGGESSAVPVTRNRPPVSDQPVLWYEMHHSKYAIGRLGNQYRRKGQWLLPLITILLVYLFSFVAADVGKQIWESYYKLRGLRAKLSMSFPQAYTDILWLSGPVAWLTIVLPAGLRAARLVARERQRDTLDSLLLTSLEPDQILLQKKWSVLRHALAPCLILFTIWGIGLYLGRINVSALVLFVLVALANISLAVALGQICSINSKTPLNAMAKFVFVLIAWFVADWMLSCGFVNFDQKYMFFCLLSPFQICLCTNNYILWGDGDMYWVNGIVPLIACAGLMVSALATLTANELSSYFFRQQVRPDMHNDGPPT